MKALSPMDEKLLGFIRSHMKAHGISPTLNEMRVIFGYQSNSYAHHRVKTLIAAGFVKRTVRGARGIELIQTEDYHLPNCDCRGCGELRYLAQLKLVQAIKVAPKISPGVRLVGLRSPTVAERADLLGIKNSVASRVHRGGATIPSGGCR